MCSLREKIKDRIRRDGPISVETFMGLAVDHYYKTRDPFGVKGDFTTAPEISQMFGELIGAWVADTWARLGRPDPFLLVECGPGRGTLMADALRATKKVEGFHKALNLNLVETSPVLKEKQKNVLAGYNPHWHDTLQTLSGDIPLVLVANEFLDALPIRQLQKAGGEWKERVVTENFTFDLVTVSQLPDNLPEADIYEISPVRNAFIRDLSDRLKKQTGAALFIDYGHDRHGTGETMQAVKAHAFAPVLDNMGEADLSAHVDFEAVSEVAKAAGISVSGPVEQGAFLGRLGIDIRADVLNQQAEKERLTSPDKMGRLFRVMALCHDEIQLSGF